jgi:hypothetical protein
MNLSYQIPHLFWSRLLLSHILKGNGQTTYRHISGPIFWGPYDNHPIYISITDCSGFINALLQKSYHFPTGWLGKNRPYAITYYNQIINNENNFINITNIKDAKIGDFIVFRILPGTSKTNDTGHIMIINDLPKIIQNKTPIITDTQQWVVQIIDQTANPHGQNDTRNMDNNNKTGLGIGYFRIYTDTNGLLKGYAWSTDNNSKFIDTTIHPLVIGRLELDPDY